MSLLDILSQYAGGGPVPPAEQTTQHFEQASQQVPAPQLGNALSQAFRSDATPPFPNMVGQMFTQSPPQQQAGLLNEIIASLGSGGLQGLGGAGGLGGILGSLLGGAAPGMAPPSITPQQASQVSPQDVQVLAEHAQQQDPGILDRVGSFYGQHPMIVKTLGAVALSAIMGQLSRRN